MLRSCKICRFFFMGSTGKELMTARCLTNFSSPTKRSFTSLIIIIIIIMQVTRGQSARLPCRVKHLQDFVVLWRKGERILTAGKLLVRSVQHCIDCSTAYIEIYYIHWNILHTLQHYIHWNIVHNTKYTIHSLKYFTYITIYYIHWNILDTLQYYIHYNILYTLQYYIYNNTLYITILHTLQYPTYIVQSIHCHTPYSTITFPLYSIYAFIILIVSSDFNSFFCLLNLVFPVFFDNIAIFSAPRFFFT